MPDLAVRDGTRLRLLFHPGQWRAWESDRRFVAIIAGTQSGKSVFGPHWLRREMSRRGPGDYMVVTPTFPLLQVKALPEFLKLFKTTLRLGDFTASPARRFTVSEQGAHRLFGHRPDYLDEARTTPTHVYFGHAGEPESLEAATAKGFWLDEVGQKRFKLASWEALQRRGAVYQARYLLTTTPYDLGWLKQKIYDRWRAGDADVDVITFDSTENPAFPPAEFDRARETLPAWKFRMFYRGRFERPAGLIYDSFDETHHRVPRFALPDRWPRYLGLDFGGVNTAGVFYAEEPGTGRLFAYREYKAGGRSAAAHVRHLLAGEPMVPTCVGGSRSEGQWRQEFAAAGLPVQEPLISDVEVGIDRVYAAHAENQIIVFDVLAGYLEQKSTYSREVDENGDPTEKIEDKDSYHYLDAERYIVGWLRGHNEATWGPAPALYGNRRERGRHGYVG
jgi:hypothetical protein